jgi:hypothetical protein
MIVLQTLRRLLQFLRSLLARVVNVREVSVASAAPGGPTKGVPISPGEIERMKELQSFFNPEVGLKRLEDFAKWLFTAVAAVGVLGAAFSNAAFAGLERWGKTLFAAAIVAAGVSLAGAALSLNPRWVVANLSSRDSMTQAVAEAYRARRMPLTLAASGFVVALLMAAAAPITSYLTEPTPPRSRVTYSWDDERNLNAHVTVSGLEPFSSVHAMMRGRPFVKRGKGLFPRAMTVADERGNAFLDLKLRKLPQGDSRMTIIAEWVENGDEGTQTTRKILLPRRFSTVEQRARRSERRGDVARRNSFRESAHSRSAAA